MNRIIHLHNSYNNRKSTCYCIFLYVVDIPRFHQIHKEPIVSPEQKLKNTQNVDNAHSIKKEFKSRS